MKTEITTVETAKEFGLLPEEFEMIKKIIGRVPNFTELAMYSVMWSEHCSYKNSLKWLKTLPREGKCLLAEAGKENAGLVDIGNGLACAFKIESHNHPSAVEPYQGAATGVGGINRDIFTMGARPIAQLNSLRFGDLSLDRTKWHLRGVVKGIGDYGNSFGIPVIAGEVYFDECYNTNPLVNAMSAGIVRTDEIISAIAEGEGNPVYIVGSSTGKDGIHGASFASRDITEQSAEDLPSVQVGDPFTEKTILEATQEAVKTGALVGMQDMGAAGITCSTSEMSAKGNHGMIINLDLVPLRQTNMKPFEILLSESQERMLLVVKKGREKKIENIFSKWDINCVKVGEVTAGNRLQFFLNHKKIVDLPADSLVLGGGAPVYERESKEPSYYRKTKKFSISSVPEPRNLKEIALFLLCHPDIASKKWVYGQYDTMVQTINASTNAPADAGVVHVKGTGTLLFFTVDCNARYVHSDPETGAAIAVAEAARNIVCSGGKPLAITNCLNFGNPYNPEVYWQFTGAVKGMGKACRRFNTPVTGGNVSFYNQTTAGGSEIPVFPTPVIGMLGIRHFEPAPFTGNGSHGNPAQHMTLDFKNQGDRIYLIGRKRNDISGSTYLYAWHKVKLSPPPYFDIEEEWDIQRVVSGLIETGLIRSAHDCSEGGLFVCLAESAMVRKYGFDIRTDPSVRKDAFLFGEAQSRIVVSVNPADEKKFQRYLERMDAPYSFLGEVAAGKISVDGEMFGTIDEMAERYNNSIEELAG